ncbi:MAG TPA: RNase adapter RapZ [Acetivibrio sp.]|uniref:RNase adapter RapZ n=1 Tax=Acetivibrio sp. TaxID=1872092 RepID=UPI002BBE78A6|nr:RNase adapter RapZ [Acetivibrio sp.]HOM01651.1 RNase adapter RapZ [Acetivibrio sp.]
MRLLIITGISGAGKSLVVKYLEDIGFFCVDNLPPVLISKFAEICVKSRGKISKIALVIDIRGGELFNDLVPELNALKEAGIDYEILFLDASDHVLIKRYKESRRIHPLAAEGRLVKGIKTEREILSQVRKNATYVIDTSNLMPRQLKEEILAIFVEGRKFDGMIVNIVSFGFKYGIPIECDLVFDVRFIPNPYYIDSMRNKTGKEEVVRDYVMGFAETTDFLTKLEDLLDFLIPNYIKEGKSQLVIGVGCTGGRHRSVAISEALFSYLCGKQHRVFIDHRDIDKDGRSKRK